MKWKLIALSLALATWNAGALECASPSVLKQADGEGNTLHSWCEVDGKRDGAYEVFALDGGLKLHAEFKNGQLDGKFRRFKNGKVVSEGAFRDGKMSGEWTRYSDDGRVRDQGQWKDDHPFGTWTIIGADQKATHKVDYDDQGKPVEKQEVRDYNTRIDFGLMQSKLHNGNNGGGNCGGPGPCGGNNDGGDNVFIALGAERRLLHWSDWLRLDLTARIFKEKLPNKGDGTISAQVGLELDLLHNLTKPFGFYFRLGPHFPDLDKPHMFVGLGLRYLPKTARHFSGVFLEIIHVDYHGDLNQNYSTGPGPGPYMSNDVQTDAVFLGTMYSF